MAANRGTILKGHSVNTRVMPIFDADPSYTEMQALLRRVPVIGDWYFNSASTSPLYISAISSANVVTWTAIDSSSVSLDGAFNNGKVIDGATSAANAMQVGGTNDKILFYEEGSNDMRITTSAGSTLTITPAGGATTITGTLNATSTFTVATNKLSVNATTGTLTSTGNYLSSNTAAENAFAVPADGSKFAVVASTGTVTSAGYFLSTATAAANVFAVPANGSKFAVLASTGTVTSAGNFVSSNTANENVFCVPADGSKFKVNASTGTVTIAGDCAVTGNITGTFTGTWGSTTWAANPVITLSATTGNGLTLDADTVTSGDVIHIDADTSLTGYFIRCLGTATGLTQCFAVGADGATTIKGTAVGSGALTLSTGDVSISDGNVDITTSTAHAGDLLDITRGNAATAGDAIDIDMGSAAVSGDAIDISWAGAGTGAALRIAMANAATTAQALVYTSNVAATAAPFSIADTGFVGATGVGLMTISDSANLAHANASCLLIAYSGTGAANGLGTSLRITDTGATSTSHAVYVSAATGSALYVAGSGTVDTITMTSAAAAASGLKMTMSAATGTAVELISAASSTVSAISLTNTGTAATGWLGASNVGMVSIVSDGNLAHANASMLYIAYSGTGAATGLGTSLRIVDTGATNTSTAVYVSTGASGGSAIQVVAGGTANDSIVVTSAATAKSALKITTSVATGKVVELISAASATVSAMSFANSGTGATGWLGADGIGMVSVVGDGNLAHANASLVRIAYSGTGAATGLGTSLAVIDTGATNTSAAVYLSTGATGGNALRIAASGTANDSVVISSAATTKSALKVTTTVVTGTAAEFICAADTTVSMVKVDGSTGNWIGAATTGLVNITCDGALAETTTSCFRIAYSGAPAQASSMGTSMRIVDTGSVATAYAVYLSAGTGEALIVDTGRSRFDECVTMKAVGLADAGAGSNRIFGVPNHVTCGGGANDITVTLHDGDNVDVPLAEGLELWIDMGATTLQAGANNIDLNGGGNKRIYKSSAPTVDKAVAVAANGIVHVVYNGTSWLDMSE